MKCSICGATDHFRANCPRNNNSGGSGGGDGRHATFGGLASLSTREHSGTISAIQSAVRGSGSGDAEAAPAFMTQDVAPPWGEEIFEAPRDIFTVFGEGEPQDDPMQDP